MINILDFGAVGDGKFMNTEAFAKAVEAGKTLGEAICVPAGNFLTGTINLQGVSLHLEPGAVIKGSSNLADYPDQDYVHNEMGVLRALIVNLNEDNVSISGSGTIDLSGSSFFDPKNQDIPQPGFALTEKQISECTYIIQKRPSLSIFFHNSKNISFSGITIVDAPCWTLTCSECENVKIRGLTIDTDLNIPNDDGIHISSCKGVIISDCNISSGDDCIALSCITNWEKPCEDIVITNCVLKSCSKAIVIGYIYSVVRNVLVSNCIIKESNRGLCFMCNDECGLIENVRAVNMIIETRIRAGNWWGNGEPVFLMAVKQDSHLPYDQKPERVTDCAIKNVHINGVSCIGENAIGIVGIDNNIKEVTLSNVDFIRKRAENLAIKGAEFDLAPSAVKVKVPEECGLLISGADDVVLESINTREWGIIR